MLSAKKSVTVASFIIINSLINVNRRAAHQNFLARLQVQQREDQEEIGHVLLHEGGRARVLRQQRPDE
jgi:hypothetical protein